MRALGLRDRLSLDERSHRPLQPLPGRFRVRQSHRGARDGTGREVGGRRVTVAGAVRHVGEYCDLERLELAFPFGTRTVVVSADEIERDRNQPVPHDSRAPVAQGRSVEVVASIAAWNAAIAALASATPTPSNSNRKEGRGSVILNVSSS